MGSVFISYSSKDRDRVAVIADTLRAAGFEVWWDREIPVATTYHEHIQKQLEAAQAVVVVWSPASVASQYVLWEAQKAHRRGKLVPALIEEADLPPDFFLIQAADLTHWRGSPVDPEWKRLTGALSRLVSQDPVEPPVTPVSPAPAARPSPAAPQAARTRPTPAPQTPPGAERTAAASRPWYARRSGLAALGGAGLLAVVVAVLVMSGGGIDPTTTLAGTTTVVTTTTDASSTSAATTTAATLATTTTEPFAVPDLAWSRIWSEGSDVFGGSGDQRMLALVRWDSGFVAVGQDSAQGRQGGAVWISEDGLVWDKVAGNDDIGGVMYGIAAGGPGLVAVGYSGVGAGVWTSTDGVTWEQVPYDQVFGGDETMMYAVASAGPGLVAVGEDSGRGAVWTSMDGIVWEPSDGEFGETPMVSTIRSVVAGGPLGIVAAGATWFSGYSDAAVWISDDGATWERIDSEALLAGELNQWINAITVGGPGLVAVGGGSYTADDSDAVVWVSSDGREWTRVGDASIFGGEGRQEMFGVAKGDLGQFAVGSDGRGDWDAAVWASSDGTTWERVVVPMSAEDAGQMQAVVVTDSRVVGVGVIDWQTGEVVPGQSIGAGQEPDAVAWVGLPVGSG